MVLETYRSWHITCLKGISYYQSSDGQHHHPLCKAEAVLLPGFTELKILLNAVFVIICVSCSA